MEFIDMLMYLLPMLFLSGIFYLLVDKLIKGIQTLQKTTNKENSAIILQKLQAYERLTLFLERIKPTYLVRRIDLKDSITEYEYSLISSIQEEFNHNLSQQIYINKDTWNLILSAKNNVQNFIKELNRLR